MLKIKILKIEMHVRLYGGCGTDLGRLLAEVRNNIHAIGVVKPVYGYPNLPTTRKSLVIKRTHI